VREGLALAYDIMTGYEEEEYIIELTAVLLARPSTPTAIIIVYMLVR
jgi:hypothetical protein